MPNERGVYVANNNPTDYQFLYEHFVEGTKWFIYSFGDPIGLCIVGERYELSGKVVNEITRIRDGKHKTAFIEILEAKPYVPKK